MNEHNFFMKLLDTGLPATLSVFLHRQPRPLFLRPAIRRLSLLPVIYSAAADSKTSPMNPVRSIPQYFSKL